MPKTNELKLFCEILYPYSEKDTKYMKALHGKTVDFLGDIIGLPTFRRNIEP